MVIPLNHYSSPISTVAPLRVTRRHLQQYSPNQSMFACFLLWIGRFVLSWVPQAQLTVKEGVPHKGPHGTLHRGGVPNPGLFFQTRSLLD